MKASLQLTAGAIAWAILLWGALQLAHVHTSWDHALCGAWGCGPTLTAVISCHLAWSIVLVPMALVVRWVASPRRLRPIGVALTVLAVAVLLGVVSGEAATWLRQAPDGYGRYFAQRCLFVVATWVDLPLVELGVLSLLWWARPGKPQDEEAAACFLGSGEFPDHLQPVEIVNAHDHRRK